MKTRTSTTWRAGLVVALMTALAPVGRAQNESNPSSTPRPDTTPTVTTPRPARAANIAPPEILPPTGATANLRNEQGPPFRVQLSYWAGEIVKLAEAGIDDDVMLAFLDDVGTFNLGADQIIYLSDIGVSSKVIAAMLQHDFEFVAGNRPATAWMMPSSHPPVRLVLVTNTVSSALSSSPSPASPPPPAAVASARPPGDPAATAMNQDLTAAVLAALAYAPDSGIGSAPSTPAPGGKAKLYAVREPYPEQITDPIIVLRYPGPMPNVQVLEMFR